MTSTIVTPQRVWTCSRCKASDVTREARPHTRFHACPAMHGLTMPMVEEGTTVQVTIVEREDYIGDETVTTVGGRPIMSIVTERTDGSNDVAVFAAAAHANVKE